MVSRPPFFGRALLVLSVLAAVGVGAAVRTGVFLRGDIITCGAMTCNTATQYCMPLVFTCGQLRFRCGGGNTTTTCQTCNPSTDPTCTLDTTYADKASCMANYNCMPSACPMDCSMSGTMGLSLGGFCQPTTNNCDQCNTLNNTTLERNCQVSGLSKQCCKNPFTCTNMGSTSQPLYSCQGLCTAPYKCSDPALILALTTANNLSEGMNCSNPVVGPCKVDDGTSACGSFTTGSCAQGLVCPPAGTEIRKCQKCGNGVIDGGGPPIAGVPQVGEQCDDGNFVNNDSCSNQCLTNIVPVCGNGTKEGTEECDDGNQSNTDACTNACKNAFCGDKFLRQGVEECDPSDGVFVDTTFAGNYNTPGSFTATQVTHLKTHNCLLGCKYTQCSDNKDNDTDGTKDQADVGCFYGGSYLPGRNEEVCAVCSLLAATKQKNEEEGILGAIGALWSRFTALVTGKPLAAACAAGTSCAQRAACQGGPGAYGCSSGQMCRPVPAYGDSNLQYSCKACIQSGASCSTVYDCCNGTVYGGTELCVQYNGAAFGHCSNEGGPDGNPPVDCDLANNGIAGGSLPLSSASSVTGGGTSSSSSAAGASTSASTSTSPTSSSKASSSASGDCSDNADNETDGLKDTEDPDCYTDGSMRPETYDPTRKETTPSMPVVNCPAGTTLKYTSVQIAPIFNSILLDNDPTGKVPPAGYKGTAFDDKIVNLSLQPGDKVFVMGFAIDGGTAAVHYTDDFLELSGPSGSGKTVYNDATCQYVKRSEVPIDVTNMLVSGSGPQPLSVPLHATFRDYCRGYENHSPYFANIARCVPTSSSSSSSSSAPSSASCTNDSQCSGKTCVNGTCVGCTTDSQCATGAVCRNGSCNACIADNQCATGVCTGLSSSRSSDSTLVAYWPLDTGVDSTVAYDLSGNGNNGKLTNGPIWSTDVSRSLTFDGTNDFVSVNDASSLRITQALTVSAWVKYSSAQINKGIVGKYDTATNNRGYAMFVANDGVGQKISFTVQKSGSVFDTQAVVTTSRNLNDGAWHHVAGVFSPSTMLMLYVDGVFGSQSASAPPASIFNSNAPLQIGSYNQGTSNVFKGGINDVRIYNRALSAPEIAALAVANPNIGGMCSCANNNQCATGVCTNGSCVSCTTNNQCASGVCKNGSCSSCTSSNECSNGAVCTNGSCTACTANNQCATGVCTNGSCVSCTTNNQCASGLCKNGSCSGCTNSNECSNGAVCTNGSCTACTGNNQCATGVCKNGSCVGCGSANDCSNGAVCTNGSCAPCTANNQCTSGVCTISSAGSASSDAALLAYWPFDNGTGSTIVTDASGHSGNGTLVNGPTWSTDVPSRIQFPDPKTLHFDGTNDYVSMGTADLIEGKTAASVCVWIKADATPTADGGLVGHYRQTPNAGWLLWVDDITLFGNTTDSVSFMVDNAGNANGRVEGPTNMITPKAWQHICGTFQGGQFIKLYNNGALVATRSTSVPAKVQSTSNSLLVGKTGHDVPQYFKGSMDDMRIYDRALSASEIASLYDGAGGAPQSVGVCTSAGSSSSASSASQNSSASQCTANAQCPSQLCLNGQCTSCTSNNQCPTNICKNGVCLGCVFDGECSANAICRNGSCMPCDENSQCTSGLCVNGACASSSSSSSSSQAAVVAAAASSSSQCTANAQCPSQLCLNGQCTSCTSNNQCPTNMCSNGICLGCVFDRDCPVNSICRNGSCAPCTSNNQCTSGMCVNGTCASTTSSSAPNCSVLSCNGTCVNGSCIPDDPSVCSPQNCNGICLNGACITDDEPSVCTSENCDGSCVNDFCVPDTPSDGPACTPQNCNGICANGFCISDDSPSCNSQNCSGGTCVNDFCVPDTPSDGPSCTSQNCSGTCMNGFCVPDIPSDNSSDNPSCNFLSCDGTCVNDFCVPDTPSDGPACTPQNCDGTCANGFCISDDSPSCNSQNCSGGTCVNDFCVPDTPSDGPSCTSQNCDGACVNGFCVPDLPSSRCNPQSCNGMCVNDVCVPTPNMYGCRTTIDCRIGSCVEGSCSPCASDRECLAGRCVNSRCTGGSPNLVAGSAVTMTCGNGSIDPGEQCDDAMNNSNFPNARCRTDCRLGACGDRVVDTSYEACDDGNLRPGDGCSVLCQNERGAPSVLPATILQLPIERSGIIDGGQTTDRTVAFYGQQQQQPLLAQTTPLGYAPYAVPPQNTQSGPAALAVMAAGASAGYTYMKRKWKKGETKS